MRLMQTDSHCASWTLTRRKILNQEQREFPSRVQTTKGLVRDGHGLPAIPKKKMELGRGKVQSQHA